MNMEEITNEILYKNHKVDEVHIWHALIQLAPNLSNKLGMESPRVWYKTSIYLEQKGHLVKSSISGRKDKVRMLVNKKYGFYRSGIRFHNIELAKEFFIEIGFLNPDGTELEY